MTEETALKAEEPVAGAAPEELKKEEHQEDPTTISEYLESLLVTVLLALFGTSFVVQAFKIPSASMEGTLLIGDHLLVNKFIFEGSGAWYEKVLPYRPLERGDIIVFKYPYADHQHFVKRVIGLPGDRLKLVDQSMYVNGKLLNEPYVVHDQTAPYDNFNYSFPPGKDQMISPQVVPESGWRNELRRYVQGDELVVPPGKIFAMGDNRDRSSDSRYWGFVDGSAIMGRPFLIYWSVEATSSDYTQTTFLQRLESVFETLAHLPARTRWARMLRTVH
ncbi:MAG TPA: signal peptidase I [Candidatus Acidoferrum sp.]|jgi:signal peptidase I|nr:signal peptidase I [Candidatus Acidoferrum sp.]